MFLSVVYFIDDLYIWSLHMTDDYIWWTQNDVHWRHYLKSWSNFKIFSNQRPFQTRISIGPLTWSKFAIKNNCNDSFVLHIFFFYLFLKVFVLCVFKAFSHSLILFRVKVRIRVRVTSLVSDVIGRFEKVKNSHIFENWTWIWVLHI